MKKIIFTLLLAIVSSVWTTSKALCLSPIPDALYQPFATVSGTFASVPIPCEPIDEYPCPACLTLALQTSDRLYYLTADNADIQTQLEAIEYQLSLTTNITGSVSGIPYTEESYEYIRVQAVDTNSAPLRLPSICDEWNVLVSSFCWPTYSTGKYYLSTDTIINGQHYIKLTSDYYSYLNYNGAMREGTNADIYYVPAGSTNEFLLYAFNAQVGEVLNNLYLGGFEENSYTGRVEAISDGSPRIFTIRVLYPTGMGEEPGESFSVTWIEGVGSPETPYGLAVVPSVPIDNGVYTLLCAYKNGEHIYTSDLGKKYGCEYNYDPYLTPDDTIPLYIKDNSGTSTVDPADPNLIYAVLRNDMLIIRDFTGVEIFLTLSRNGSLFSPRRARRVQAQQSFTDSTSVELSEEGTYDIELTSESWNYIVVGSFDFNKTHEAVEIIPNERPAASKILRNGQLLIRIGDQLYTPSGVMVQ